MRRRKFITAAGAVGAGLASAGCTSLAATPIGNTGETTSPSVSGSNTQVDQLNVNGQFIHVAASGAVETEPDTASISVVIEASGSEAEAVREELASRAEELKDALLEYGLNDEQITTGRYDIREHRNDGTYRGINEFRINVEDVDSVGELIDTAVDGGGR
ncbi:SIMPL domain-containing protein [Halalkalirubrum salinum]|uniref:SIMPL domain-containing protein n=1 Tax=Halalkalirubrum salinum TaxID=2563889 RepID=UPI001485C185|nr:SIMPL domain-containing protein [Halalkalirubrum salinum]